METLTQDYQKQYIEALWLSITAPNNELTKRCEDLADSIGSNLTVEQMLAIKKTIEKTIELKNQGVLWND